MSSFEAANNASPFRRRVAIDLPHDGVVVGFVRDVCLCPLSLYLSLMTAGTVIWTAPDGTTHVTTPGSRLLFPELSEPTAPLTTTNGPATPNTGLTMPRRKTTRAEDRRRRIRAERVHNQTAGEAQAPEPPPPF